MEKMLYRILGGDAELIDSVAFELVLLLVAALLYLVSLPIGEDEGEGE